MLYEVSLSASKGPAATHVVIFESRHSSVRPARTQISYMDAWADPSLRWAHILTVEMDEISNLLESDISTMQIKNTKYGDRLKR